ncbi:ankyrin repeat domain-containing protein [Skeletonema marinoi]|uniref:Ankyrin repeat domain-containing protein n=1 Tax=Skeletonema marinoi TaxID=267567 RepID=A0AAD9D619_9STRA|nr:ankyrin repeat domain-containing protein [Skeletonema marinoi]
MMSNSKPKLLNPVAVLLGLILNKDWKMIRTLIAATSPDCFRDLASSISSCSQHKLNGMTLLHAIVRDNPPLDIVANIIRLCPEMAAARDGLGRTPLHIAAGSKASPLLLKLIACAYPAACDAQDEDERTPLHFVCDTSFVLFADHEDADPSSTPQDQKAPKQKHEAIITLLSESLFASTIEDADEMSPLEHAIMCGASLKTDWKMIRTLIAATSPDCFRDLADSISSCSQHKLNGMTLLHAIVRDNPPLDIVANIIRLTPLHFVCDTTFVLFADHEDGDYPSSTPQDQKAPKQKHEAIITLLSESLFASTIEDVDEMSPLEHAIMCGASLKTVKLLQASATKSLRSRVRSASPNPDPRPGTNKRRRASIKLTRRLHINAAA